jgi:hypothetical protein
MTLLMCLDVLVDVKGLIFEEEKEVVCVSRAAGVLLTCDEIDAILP